MGFALTSAARPIAIRTSGATIGIYTAAAGPQGIPGLPGADGTGQVNSVNGIAPNATTHDVSLTAADVGAVGTALLGAANGVATLDSSGVVASAQIPALALVSATTVASQSAMLALSDVQPGDLAVRTDGAGTFILTAAPASTLSNWTRLNAPTDAVTSVNGQVGTVALIASDVGALSASANLSDVPSAASARSNLGLTIGTTSGTIAAGDDSRITGAATKVKGGQESVSAFSGTSGTVIGDLSSASTFTLSPTAAATISFANFPASGTSAIFTVEITQGATVQAITWPASVKWSGGVAPVQTASKTCVATFYTRNGGSTLYGSAGIY